MPVRVTATEAVRRVAALEVTGWAFVGIDGRGAAGKSTLAQRLAAAVPGTQVVAVDDFSGPSVEEWDWGRFRTEVLTPIVAGRTARYRAWNWDADRAGDWREVRPEGLIVVEGVSSTRSELDVPWASTIWVEASRETRLRRARARDGDAMMSTWLDRWMPSEEAYIAREHPERRVDLVVDTG